MRQFLINQSQLQHIFIQYRQIIIHVSLLQLLHGKSSDCPAVLMIHLRLGFLGCNNIVI